MNKRQTIIFIVFFIIGYLLGTVIIQRFKIVELKQNQESINKNVEVTLEECPFCDGNANIQRVNDSFYIECDDCELHTDYFDSELELINYWNSRMSQ